MKINKFTLIIGLIIFFQLSGFYLLDEEIFHCSDVALLLEVFLFIQVYYGSSRLSGGYEYGFFFLFPIVMAVLAAYTANANYDQPILMGLRPQRTWIVTMLMYFPINRLIKSGRYNANQLLNTIDVCNILLFFIVLVQYIIGDRFIFLHLHNNIRYGTVRLYVQSIFLLVSFMRYFAIGLQTTFWRFKTLFFIFIPAFIIIVVSKSRMAIVAFVGAIAIVILRQRFSAKKLGIMSVVVVLICVFMTTTAGEDLLVLISGGTSVSDNTGTIREMGRELYLANVMSSAKNMILGCGYPSNLWGKTTSAIGYDKGYLIVDNGVIGQFFVYGLIYLLWMIGMYIRFFKKAFKIRNDFLIGFFLTGILGIYSLVPHCNLSYIAFPIMAVLCENSETLEEEI